MGKYIIIKQIKALNGTIVPVIILDGAGEVLELETKAEADNLKTIFQKNSDSGHLYEVKQI